MRKIFYAVTITVLCASLSSCVKNDDETVNDIVVGDKIPQFSLTGFLPGENGSTAVQIGSADFSGKRGMMVFFASYCPSCHTIMDRIEAVYKELGDDEDYAIAVISRQSDGDTPQKVAVYWSEKKYKMPYYLDYNRQLYDKFANRTIPRVYIIDAGGVVEFMSVGELKQTSAELIDMIRK